MSLLLVNDILHIVPIPTVDGFTDILKAIEFLKAIIDLIGFNGEMGAEMSRGQEDMIIDQVVIEGAAIVGAASHRAEERRKRQKISRV